ncbi:MAG: hypothetical protein ACSHYA_10850 [Opitutaceae bacterium]
MTKKNQPKSAKLNDESGLSDDYALIGTLEGAKNNQEFQNNVHIMQSLRKEAITLREQIQAETDEAKKAQQQEKFDSLEKKINENNQKMIDTYKYSLNRNYTQVIKKGRVYIQLTDEEIKKQKAQNPKYSVPKDNLADLLTIEGVKANQDFINNVQIMQALRNKIIQAKQTLENETDKAKIAEQQAQIDADTKKLTENNKLMVKTYKYSLERNYHYVAEVSDLYLQLTPEEIAKRKPTK